MPAVDGCAVIGQLRALTATDDYLPIIVLTADITPPARQRALTASATDFLTKPFDGRKNPAHSTASPLRK